MTTDKQLEANRANAKKSTGPKSQGGKARSRLNSRKHGLTAKKLVIVGERAVDFDQLRSALMDEHDPQSTLECELVERLAGVLWRLRRVPFLEAAILDARRAQARSWSTRYYCDGEKLSDEQWRSVRLLGGALIEDGTNNDALGKLARHETTLMNAFTKTLQMLLLLQENRSNTKSEPLMLDAVALSPAA